MVTTGNHSKPMQTEEEAEAEAEAEANAEDRCRGKFQSFINLFYSILRKEKIFEDFGGVKMAEVLTDAQVEMEIERLSTSKYVRLARAEVREKYRRRQYLYQLRQLEKRGRELDAAGYVSFGTEEGEEG